jgi:two-component sensor histidine kinase
MTVYSVFAKRLALVLLIIFSLFETSKAQMPTLDGSMLREGLLELKFNDAWSYHSGDNMVWASPEYDDTYWAKINPFDLKVYEMPDSLWEGYGWWRIKFRINESLSSEIVRLYFYSWGAAEIYLDGELVQSYGEFSKLSSNEQTFTPNYDGDRPLTLKTKDVHTLAIRFSNHAAKENHAIFKYFSEMLGFKIGFSTAERARFSDLRYAHSFAALAVITVVLSLLLVLHILLYIRFRKEQANAVIILITFFFITAAVCAHILLFVDLNGFSNPILSGIINSTAFGLGFGLLPYSLSLLFRIEKYYWTKHIVWLAFIRTANYFIHVFNFILFDAFTILSIIFLMLIIMRIAIRAKNKGVHFVTFGAIGTSVFLLVNRMINTGIISLSTTMYYLDLILLYISFPLGIYIYITSQFGRLFIEMEKEVVDRTHDLNLSIDNLTKTQKELSAKNSENELLLKEIHHRVKNNLEIVSSLLELQSSQIDDPTVQAAMLSSQNRVHSMGIIHQKLYQSEHLTSIEMRDYFVNLGQNISNSFSPDGKVKIECNMPELVLDIDTAISVGLIANELLTNAFKYAFEGKDGGKIEINLKSNEQNDDKLELKIMDNGIGKSANKMAKGTGFGTTLVELLTKQINGTISYENENGTKISLIFAKTRNLA